MDPFENNYIWWKNYKRCSFLIPLHNIWIVTWFWLSGFGRNIIKWINIGAIWTLSMINHECDRFFLFQCTKYGISLNESTINLNCTDCIYFNQKKIAGLFDRSTFSFLILTNLSFFLGTLFIGNKCSSIWLCTTYLNTWKVTQKVKGTLGYIFGLRGYLPRGILILI